MNNKVRGTQFEKEICKILADHGYWVHFMSPDNRGAQPFDIIAVRHGFALAADCKTCKANIFSISRLEDNQRTAFDKWLADGNTDPVLFVKHDGKIYIISYAELVKEERIRLNEDYRWK